MSKLDKFAPTLLSVMCVVLIIQDILALNNTVSLETHALIKSGSFMVIGLVVMLIPAYSTFSDKPFDNLLYFAGLGLFAVGMMGVVAG